MFPPMSPVTERARIANEARLTRMNARPWMPFSALRRVAVSMWWRSSSRPGIRPTVTPRATCAPGGCVRILEQH
jgi:hypothetical protein